MNIQDNILAIQLMTVFAQRAVQAEKLLDLIANETPFDNTHYAKAEETRDVYCDVCKTIETVYKLDPGATEYALRTARNTPNDSNEIQEENKQWIESENATEFPNS